MIDTLNLPQYDLDTPEADTRTIKDYVLSDFRSAAIFEKYGLDFCCGGGKTLLDACTRQGVQYDDVKLELDNLDLYGRTSNGPGGGVVNRFSEWSIGFLAEYIVNNHHAYVRSATPVILMHADKVARVHAERWPYMGHVAELFAELASELGSHMYKEEAILFPRLSQFDAPNPEPLLHAANEQEWNLAAPIAQMLSEHDTAGDIMARIRTLTDHYTLPEGGCMTFRTLLDELHAFERDLHQHVFLENNVLFPKVLIIEEANRKRISN